MATHSSILAWRIPWTEKPSGLQLMGSQRVRHDLACMHPCKDLSSVEAESFCLFCSLLYSQYLEWEPGIRKVLDTNFLNTKYSAFTQVPGPQRSPGTHLSFCELGDDTWQQRKMNPWEPESLSERVSDQAQVELGDLAEGLRKQGFTLDWMCSGHRGTSMLNKVQKTFIQQERDVWCSVGSTVFLVLSLLRHSEKVALLSLILLMWESKHV